MKKQVAIGIGIVVAIGVAGAVLARSSTVAGAVASAQTWAREAGAIAVVAFVVAYIVATVLFLPGSILTIAAGFIYGVGWGTLLAAPTATVAATVAFVAGRAVGRAPLARRFGEGAQFRAIDAVIETRGALVVTLLRLSPIVPFVVLNYVLSLTKVKTRTYVVASAVGMLPGTILYVYLGSLASTATEAASGGAAPSGLRLALLAAGLVATVLVVVVIARLSRRELARAGATSDAR